MKLGFLGEFNMDMGFENNQRFTDFRKGDLFYMAESKISSRQSKVPNEPVVFENSFETAPPNAEPSEQKFPDGQDICNACVSWAAYRSLNQSARSYQSLQRLNGPNLKRHKISVAEDDALQQIWLKIAEENFAQVLYDIEIERTIERQKKKAEDKKVENAKIKKHEEIKAEIKAEERE